MPLALEPNQSFPVVLESDKDKPAESRPTFFAVACSMRDQRRISSLHERWADGSNFETVEQLYDEATELLTDLLVGWKNMVDPKTGEAILFDAENINRVLGYVEARELIELIRNNQFMTHEEKKSSDLQQQFDRASSVEVVPETSAETQERSGNQTSLNVPPAADADAVVASTE